MKQDVSIELGTTKNVRTSSMSSARVLTPAAQRAVGEAEVRQQQVQPKRPTELHGRGGLEPVRYGDWEINGIAVDF